MVSTVRGGSCFVGPPASLYTRTQPRPTRPTRRSPGLTWLGSIVLMFLLDLPPPARQPTPTHAPAPSFGLT